MIELEKTFQVAANQKISGEKSAYLRDLFPFFGITKPHRALLEKPFFKRIPSNELKKTVVALWKKEQREFHYAAIGLAKAHKKTWTPAYLSIFEAMIREKSWWDTVDDIAPNLVGFLVKKHPELVSIMDEWIDDPYLWIRRAALLHQLKWKKETDEKRLFDYCEKTMHEKEFFIRKAIGWVLREYSKSCPESVRAFLKKNQSKLSPLSIREATKYL